MIKEDFITIEYGPKYLEDIIYLWRQRHKPDYINKRVTLLSWLTSKNPYAKNVIPYFLLLRNGKVVGMHGHMPLKFFVKGVEKQGFLAHDDLIDAEHRGKGLGKILLDHVSEQAKEFSGACWFNEPNHKLYLKSGWTDVPGLYPYIKILDPEYFFKNKIKFKTLTSIAGRIGKFLLAIRDISLRQKEHPKMDIFQIEQFDERFDDLFERVGRFWGIIVNRGRDYLNWKFVQKPFNHYRRFGILNEQKELEGYAVIKTEKIESFKRGKIIDLLYNPSDPNILETLILQAIREFKKKGVSYISLMGSSPNLIEAVKRFGFVRAQTSEYFMIKNYEGEFDKDFIGNIQNWYLTYSDADGDAWNVDDLN